LPIHPNRKISLLLLVADTLAVVAVFNLVIFLRGLTPALFIASLSAPAAVFLFSLLLIDGYGASSDMLSVDYASIHFIATFSACIATLLLTFAFIPPGFELQSSRAVVLLSFGILGPLTLAYRRAIYSRTVVARGERNLIFVGEKADFDLFSAECVRMGAKNALMHADTKSGFEPFEALLESIVASKTSAEAIVVKESGKDLPADIPLRLVQLYFDGTPTYTLELFHQVYWRKIPLYRINPVWLFQEGFQIAREPVFERLKRISDILLSLIGLVLASVPIALAAIAIKIEGGGPVFFRQSRIGRHRIPFDLIKLRTMRENKGTGDPYTRKDDVRITRIGKYLRSTRFDELPQMWNVLRGHMSLIGPRAEWARLVAEYERQIPSYHFRHLVKPGITGWAQVNYRYGTGVEDTLRKLEYDLYYIRNFSFMLDASIVLKTLHVMLLQKGR
jgi:exopolysaccharide biosynthesis polyprenyl glycosylphosphotransferase